MKRHIWIIIAVFLSMEAVAQVEVSDSIKQLDEVVIRASNITRMDGHLLIHPNKRQIEHASNGFGVLKNLKIPGLSIDTQSGSVEAMGMQASLYVNGVECEAQDVRLIRPRDIERIEYHDAPKGKYAKDKIAVNFILKQYKYGGYLQADGLQTVGYTHGDYNLAGSISHGNTTYSVFAGAAYENLKDCNRTLGMEHYYFPASNVARNMDSHTGRSREHNEYGQLRIQHKKGNNYMVGKLTLVNQTNPESTLDGTFDENGTPYSFDTEAKQGSLSPKLDLNAIVPLSDARQLTFGIHGKYSRNTYDRNYEEPSFASATHEVENHGNFQLSALYNSYGKKSSFSGELYYYHNIWDATYSGTNATWQRLWHGEALAFIGHNYQFSQRLSINSRIGVDWLQYGLHGHDRFSQLSPRVNLNLRYQPNAGMLLWSFNYVNSYHGMDIINNAAIEVNPYMVERGNPDLKKSHDISTYLYYSLQHNKLGITAICRYNTFHNPVMDDYSADGSQVVKSYMNNGNIHYFSAIAAATYSLGENVILSGDIRYNHTSVKARQRKFNNDLTGNLSMDFYLGKFALSPFVNFNKQTLDQSTLAVTKIPLNYGLGCSYSNKDLLVELQMESPFNKRKKHSMLDAACYSYDIYKWDRKEYRYCSIKVAYSFDFGRKTNKVKRNVDTEINSSLLRVDE